MPMPRAILGKSPVAVNSAMYAPSPVAMMWILPHVTTSATMLAFQAAPAAVMAPVI